jgi:hypothetical protein
MAAKTYNLVFEQYVPKERRIVFAFFAQAENLEAITPEWLHFKVLAKAAYLSPNSPLSSAGKASVKCL